MLSFELANEGRAIQIFCDQQGLAAFIAAVEKARKDGDHIHLRTPADSGRDLSATNPSGHRAIPEVVLNWVGE